MKTITNITYSVIAMFAVACFALSPKAHAVSPAPDGGYPGANTAKGQDALLSLTTGSYNTAVGIFALRSDTTGSFNTAIGAGTLLANVGDPSSGHGVENTATGFGALLSSTTGANNTANGALALFNNTTGVGNTGTGDEALFSNTSGRYNTANGGSALGANITGDGNTAIGSGALFNSTGSNNTALGNEAGSNLTTGDNNIDIGYNVVGVAGEHDTIRIGNTNITTTIIRGVSGQTIPSGATVLVASNGQLGTMTCSKRFKDEIRPMDKASEAILALRPVSFRYKKEIDPQGIPQFGLVAEEVEKVNPDLVIRDAEGKPQTVRYEQVNAMLLNEFLKEHKKVEAQHATIAELRSTVARQQISFQSRLAEQERQIEALVTGLQKVSAQIELSGAQTTLAGNNQ